MKQAFGQWSISCGCPGTRSRSPGFVTLSHCSRTFHHKSRPIPPTAVEKFRAAATTSVAAADPSSPPLAALFSSLHSQIPIDQAINTTASAARTRTTSSSCIPTTTKRNYLRPFTSPQPHSNPLSSSTLPTMADEQVHWSAAKVRETFLRFFEERGHTIGKPLPFIASRYALSAPRHARSSTTASS